MKRWMVVVLGLGLVFVIVGCKKELSAICQQAADQSCTKFDSGTDLHDLCYDGFEQYTEAQCQESLKNVDELEALPPLVPTKSSTTTQ